MIAHWRQYFPNFRVLSDYDIVPLVDAYFPQYMALYHEIRIPAAKADLARLLACYKWGGLYIDCHCAIRDIHGLKELIQQLRRIELIFVDRTLEFAPRLPGEHYLINSIILSRPGSELFSFIASRAFKNLEWQRNQERQHGFVQYDISSMSGPYLITSMVFEPGSVNREIRSDFSRCIYIIAEESAPVIRGRYRPQSVPGSHWSERQRIEQLFVG